MDGRVSVRQFVQPRWWPVLVLSLGLLAGLLALAADAPNCSAAISLYDTDTRPVPSALDPGASRRVDLNHASRAELEALPGIGAVRAEAIIGARAQRPLLSLADGVARALIPRAVAEGLTELAGVGP